MGWHRVLRLASPAAVASLVAAASFSAAQAQTSFSGVGFFDQTAAARYSYAWGLTPDGLIVVGTGRGTSSGMNEAYRWQNGVMTPLGFLNQTIGQQISEARAVSADGSVVVGQSYNTAGNYQAVRWDGLAITALPFLDPAHPGSGAYGVSANGSVVVGVSGAAGGSQAVRWTGSTVTPLPFLNPLFPSSMANGVSSDGSTTVGYSAIVGFPGSQTEAVMWSSSGVITPLGFLDPSYAFKSSQATAIAGDNTSIVGDSTITGGFREAFLWNGSMKPLGFLDLTGTFKNSSATAISFDASTVVGVSSNAAGLSEAFRWQQATGMQSVRDLLVAGGVNMGTWRLTGATGVSATGLVIVGNGTDPGGAQEGWIARFGQEAGFATASGLGASVGSLDQVPDSIDDRVDSLLKGQIDFAGHSGCGDNSAAMCTYAMGTANDGFGITGLFGAAVAPAPNVVLGIGGGYGVERGQLTNGGSTELRMPTAAASIAYVPDSGLQLIGSAAAFRINANIRRGYMNGTGTATSIGTTSGSGYGARAHVGWAFLPTMHTAVTPFAEIEGTGLNLAGYTETGGPFPATIGAISNSEAISRVGSDVRVDLAPGIALWGGLAWGHRFGNAVPAIAATFPGLFSTTAPANIAGADWLEASASFRLPMSQQTTLSGGVTLAAFSAYQPTVDGDLALVRRF